MGDDTGYRADGRGKATMADPAHMATSSADLEAIAAEVRSIRERRRFGGASPVTLGEARKRLASTDSLISRMQDGSLLAGNMPPRPPTARAWFGALLVAPIRRLVFWLTHQVQEYEVAAAASLADQADLLKRAANAIEGIESVLQQVEARLDQHHQLLSQVPGLDARVAEIAARQETIRNEVAGVRMGLSSLRDHFFDPTTSE